MDGYGLHPGEWVNEDQFYPRHNIAPRSQAPVIRRRRDEPQDTQPSNSSKHPDSASNADTRAQDQLDYEDESARGNNDQEELVLHTMKWGLVPRWSKHEDTSLNTINARSEALIEGTGMWRSLRSWKRCVIPCEGYALVLLGSFVTL
jgi:putative SOS response-associated peptidase YedK